MRIWNCKGVGRELKVLVVFYSVYGHIYRMAEAVAQGAREVKGAKVELRCVPRTLPERDIKANRNH
jgi:NAD(P)H dehydrogenase (quinone)